MHAHEPTPTTKDEAYWTRAAAHVGLQTWAAPEACFVAGITDEMVTEVMYALETGMAFYRSTTGRWYAPSMASIRALPISLIIGEMIRTGLVTHLRPYHEGAPWLYDALVPAPVHLSRPDGWRSVCAVAGEGCGPKRVRLVADPRLADCPACAL